MRSFSRVFAVFSLITVLPVSGFAFADTSPLEQRLDALEQQVADLKQQLQQQQAQQAASQGAISTSGQTPPSAYVTANAKDGFAFKSADGDYSLKIGGYTQIVDVNLVPAIKQTCRPIMGPAPAMLRIALLFPAESGLSFKVRWQEILITSCSLRLDTIMP